MVRWSWVNFQCRASYNLDDSRTRAYCACSRCGWVFLDILALLCLFPPLSPSLGLSGGAMVLGKLPVPGRPTNLD